MGVRNKKFKNKKKLLLLTGVVMVILLILWLAWPRKEDRALRDLDAQLRLPRASKRTELVGFRNSLDLFRLFVREQNGFIVYDYDSRLDSDEVESIKSQLKGLGWTVDVKTAYSYLAYDSFEAWNGNIDNPLCLSYEAYGDKDGSTVFLRNKHETQCRLISGS